MAKRDAMKMAVLAAKVTEIRKDPVKMQVLAQKIAQDTRDMFQHDASVEAASVAA